ncbi:outer membrane protein assembly factor BamA [Alphaproteobacteria bacterium]|nr:outer membrane protein assembly factor BamA [Alphaproteobacteria bacterium]
MLFQTPFKYCLFAITFTILGCFGSPISSFHVEGNQRIESGTVIDYLTVKKGKVPTEATLDESLKALYASGYFSDVSIKQVGGSLIISVVENPSINRIVFEGNKALSDKILNTEMRINPRELLDKSKIQIEVQRILAFYRAKGHFSAKVTPKLITREQNRIDIIFEIQEGIAAKVRKINFIGNKKFSTDTLRHTLMTKEHQWWRFFANDAFYDPDRLEADRDNLRKFYLSKGYADFRVVSAVAELVPSRDGFIISITLDEGDRYKFGDVAVKTEIPTLQLEEMQEKIKSKKGEWYSFSLIEKDRETLNNIAGDHGYAFVDIRIIPVPNEKEKTINLTYQLLDGPKVFINRINIIGNTRTVDSVIRRQLFLAEGDAYNTTKLKSSNRKLENLGFFKKINIERKPVLSDPKQTDLDVEVQEQSTGEINFSAGYNTTSGPFGMIAFIERNLFGRAYEFSSRLYYGKKNKNINVSIEDPYFLNKDLTVGVGAVRAQDDQESESSYKQTSTGVRTWMEYHLSEPLTQRWSYGISSDNLGSIPATAAPQIRAQSGKKTTSSVIHSLTYDKRNFRFNPSEGYIASMSNQWAGLGGNIKFLKNMINASIYHAPIDDLTLSLDGQFGILNGLSQRPRISDKFTLGGTSLRGFDYSGVGPRYKSGYKEALGGDRIFSSTAEATFPIGISKDLGIRGAVFVDAGTTWDSKESGNDVYNYKALRMSAGFGFGWASPMGLIRVDFGFPFMSKPGDKRSVLLINFGTGRF